jgi:hypothetical protein
MKKVEFSAILRPRALVDTAGVTAERPPPGELAIRIVQTPANLPGAQANVGRWAWALVRTQGPNMPDKIICGAYADSLSECAARGEDAMRRHAMS